MPHRLLKVLLTAGLCTALLPAVALAKDHGKGHDRDDEEVDPGSFCAAFPTAQPQLSGCVEQSAFGVATD